MSFPSSPSNNQTSIVNGITFTYNSSRNTWTRQQTSISSAGLDDYARTTANTATNNIVILQGVNTTQNTRLSVVEGGLISANANTIYLNSLITTNNTRISVVEGGLITANANSAYLTNVNTTQNTNITFATSLAQAAFDKANTGVTTSIDDYARNTANTATNNITILQGVNATQNANITYVISLAQAAYNQANTGGGGSSNVTIATSDSFVGDGSNVAYILSVSPSSKDYTFVNFDGTVQLRSSYSLSGNTITFTEAPLAGENIEVTSFSANSSLSGASSGTTIGKAIAMSIIFGG